MALSLRNFPIPLSGPAIQMQPRPQFRRSASASILFSLKQIAATNMAETKTDKGHR
jgi:hypothetical protein